MFLPEANTRGLESLMFFAMVVHLQRHWNIDVNDNGDMIQFT